MKASSKVVTHALPLAVLLAALGLGLGFGVAFNGAGGAVPGASGSGPPGPEGVALIDAPPLASADTMASGRPVDGITCRRDADQVVAYHIHVHLAIYVNGDQRRLPAGIGITPPRLAEHFPSGLFYDVGPSDCLYWLHVHTADDVIHVEAPAKAVFVLGQFFDIWRQPLGPDQVGPAKGKVTAFLNGREIRYNPRQVPLLRHAVIQLDVGRIVSFRNVRFHVSELCASSSNSC